MALAVACALLIGLPPAAIAQEPAKKSAPKKDAPKDAAKKDSAKKDAPKKKAAPKSDAAAPAAPAGETQPTLLGQFGDWGAYTAAPGGRKVCFALAKPKSSTTNPSGRPRDPAYVFISTRPAENVRAEISVIIGYPFKTSSEAVAEIAGTNFAMYTQNDGAWIKNVADEGKMLDAMRRGADMVVKGESGRGTKTTDTFSLKGLSEALTRTGQECP
jgi:hypothetical protein